MWLMHRVAANASRIGAIGLLALLLLMVGGVTPASAGTLTVRLGVNTSGCIAQSWFGTGLTGHALCMGISYPYGGWDLEPAGTSTPAGSSGVWQINAPTGIAIAAVTVPTIYGSGLVTSDNYGWQGGDLWSGGSSYWGPNTKQMSHGGMDSSYYAFKLYCHASSCSQPVYLDVPEVDITATENQSPGLIAVGTNNLWYQSGNYVWNPPGDPWSVELYASDPSGVCSMSVDASGIQLNGPSATPDPFAFQQCPSPVDWSPGQGATVDTNDDVPAGSAGSMSLQLNATNAAGVTSSPSQTIQVDNIQPTVSLSTPDDSNPTVWVSHAVTVDASASTGPSGLASLNCSVDGATAQPYPGDGQLTVDGDGMHTVTCTAANGAVDPQGDPNTGSSSVNVAIDEAPPGVQFEPTDPSNPTQLIADTADDESGVAGGTIEMRPAGGSGSWQPLATQFDGSHLIASFDDAGLHGPYDFQATSCDQVGNCASTTQQLMLPVRLAASADVSFRKIADPLVARRVKERVRVGWHWVIVDRHGKVRRVKRGGHVRTITVIRWRERCARERTRTGRHTWSIRVSCGLPKLKLSTEKRIRFGTPVTVHGILISGQGVPIANAPVQIFTAPRNGHNQFTVARTATTDAKGAWTATLPRGPSRLIRAQYGGSATVLPAAGHATVTVPARIAISISPRRLAWSGTTTIRGRLRGGYVPPDGVALRLLIWLPGRQQPYSPVPFRTAADGTFALHWSFATGVGVATYPMSVATTATESDYPFAAGSSRRIGVTFGG